MTESLKNKAIRGVGWSAADAFLGQGITFIIGLVLARLLSPAEYGLIGICLIFTTVLNGIVDSGFSNSLIRKKDVTNDDYNTMFITNMLISVVLFVILFGLSPFISIFFNRSELTWLIRAMGLLLIFQALSITQVTSLIKKVDFKTKTKASFYSAIISGIIGIALAYCDFGVWALVVQLLSRQLLNTICLWALNKWTPSWRFSIDSFKYMWSFGWKLMVSGLLYNIWNQLNQVVVGKFYSPATLGQFTKANEYANLCSSNITIIIQRVSYPILAEIQDDQARLIAAYRRVIKTTMLVTCICMIPMAAISEPLVYCLIGSQWHDAATYLPLICINMSLYPLHAINLNMLQIQGRSDIFLYLEIVKKIFSIFPLLVGIFFDIYSMLVISVIVGILSFFLNSWYTGKKLGYSSFDQIKDIIPDYLVAILVAFSVFFLKYLPFSYWIILPLQFFVAIFCGWIINERFRLSEYEEVKGILKSFSKKRNNELF